jgi:hypothetical protein
MTIRKPGMDLSPKEKHLTVGFPVVSVIVVVHSEGNADSDPTIRSVLSQTYPNVELIVVPKMDNEAETLNHGVRQAHGQWVLILFPGEKLQDDQVLELVFSRPINADIIYGDAEIITPKYTYVRQAKRTSLLWQGMVFQLSSCFVRTALLQSSPFKTTLKYAHIFEFIYTLYSQHAQFAYIPHCFSTVELTQNQMLTSKEALKEYQVIVLEHEPLITINIYYVLKMGWVNVKAFFKPFFPKALLPVSLKVRSFFSRYL